MISNKITIKLSESDYERLIEIIVGSDMAGTREILKGVVKGTKFWQEKGERPKRQRERAKPVPLSQNGTGYWGVYNDGAVDTGNIYLATYTRKGKAINVGRFGDAREAALARDARIRADPESKSKLNFPED